MEFKRSLFVKFTVASLLILGGQLLMAQSAGTGALTGTVKDPSGAVVPNVAVTLTNNATNQSRNAATGSDGVYKFALIPPGTYSVMFAASGFKSADVPAVTVNVTETPVLDRVMEVGAASEQITVEASVETLQTASSTLGTTVTSQQIVALPLSNRNYTQLLSMAAGANVGVNDATALGKATQNISVNGADPSSNNYMMDGVSIVNTNNTGSANDSGIYAGIGIPNPDAIEEFKIQTSTYDASYGAHPGGNVNVVTKSGTNTFHGGAWEFFRNTDLNANPFFANAFGAGKEVLNQNQVGGNIGGPIKKNKVFFFANYQETRQKNGIASGGSSTEYLFPLPAVRTAATLGAALCPANNPGNKNYLTLFGTGFGGAIACDGSNISPVSLNMLNLKLPGGGYYIPSNPNGVYGPVSFSSPASFTEHQLIGNVDYIINSKNTFSARYFYTADPQTLPIAGNLPGTPESNKYVNDNAVLKLTTVVTPSLVNELHAAGQYNGAKGTDSTVSTPQAIGQATIVPTMTELPVTVMFNGPSLNGTLAPDNSPSDQIEYGDQVSFAKGKHTIRAGYEFQETKWPISFAGLERGFLFYSTFADWVIGGPGNIYQCLFCVRSGPNGIIHDYLENNHSAFAQDDWKVNSRLTINVGIRWEYDGTYSDKYGNLTNFWLSQLQTVPVPPTGPTTSGPGLVGYVVPSNYSSHYPSPPSGVLVSNSTLPTQGGPPKDNFAPRIGFAYQPLKNGKLVIRGGAGMFYDRVGGGTFVHGLEQGYPYAVTLDYSGANAFTNANPYPTTPLGTFASRWVNFNGCQPQCLLGTTATGGVATSSALDTPALDQTLHTPLTRQYNLTFQYEFAKNYVLEAGFVGSSSINLLDQYHSVNNPAIASPTNPVNGITVNTVDNAPLRVPILGYLPAGYDETSFDGISNYNSLQVTMRKNFSRGFLMQASYTWSKDESNIPGVASGSGANSNVTTATGQQYGPVNFSHPQRFVVNYSYDLPFGNPSGALGYIAKGWNVSGLTIVQDGTPLTITDQNAGTVYDLGSYDTARAQMCPGSTYSQIATSGSTVSRLNGYLNASAFCPAPLAPNGVAAGTQAAPTLYGNSGVGAILGPGQFNWDLSIVKTTRIREKHTLIFRTEFYNTFNHPQFGNPATAISTATTFGHITTTTVNPRLIQFALKYQF
jgi:hypothetical protein